MAWKRSNGRGADSAEPNDLLTLPVAAGLTSPCGRWSSYLAEFHARTVQDIQPVSWGCSIGHAWSRIRFRQDAAQTCRFRVVSVVVGAGLGLAMALLLISAGSGPGWSHLTLLPLALHHW